MTEPQNKTADLTGLRIERDESPSRRRFLYPVLATIILVAIVAAFLSVRAKGGIALRAPEVATTRIALVTPTQASPS